MNAPESILIFSNGSVAVFDKEGEQIGELQEDLWRLYFEFLETKGIDPTAIKTIETHVNGRDVYLKPFKTEGGWWNCEIITKT